MDFPFSIFLFLRQAQFFICKLKFFEYKTQLIKEKMSHKIHFIIENNIEMKLEFPLLHPLIPL